MTEIFGLPSNEIGVAIGILFLFIGIMLVVGSIALLYQTIQQKRNRRRFENDARKSQKVLDEYRRKIFRGDE